MRVPTMNALAKLHSEMRLIYIDALDYSRSGVLIRINRGRKSVNIRLLSKQIAPSRITRGLHREKKKADKR